MAKEPTKVERSSVGSDPNKIVYTRIFGNKNDGRTILQERAGTNVNLEEFISDYIDDHLGVGIECSSVVVTIVFPPKEGDYRNG